MDSDADCRLVLRANTSSPQRSSVAPNANTPQGAIERGHLAAFLSGALMKPLWHSSEQHRWTVEQSLNTMSIAERIAIEINMTEREQAMYSCDYDPLRF
jgi:hypothetical protein